MTNNETALVKELEFALKLGRAALTNEHQYSVPSLAKHNIEFLLEKLEKLEKATAECRYLAGLLDRAA
jgi:uncharacterized membrane protein